MNTRRGKSRIRKSTDADLIAIHSWLVDQEAKNVPGTFLCNWELTEECHKEGKLLVYIDGTSEQPVAYQWGSLVYPGILEVRYDMRDKGIGRKMVEHRIKQAIKRDENLLYIECTPPSSIPFWQRMGFTLLNSENGKNNAYRILEKKHRLPLNGESIDVAIRFSPEDRKGDKGVPAYSEKKPSAIQTGDGIIHLAERVSFFCKLHPDSRDPVVEVEVTGKILICDKAKYPEARALGVRRDNHTFYLDCICLPTV